MNGSGRGFWMTRMALAGTALGALLSANVALACEGTLKFGVADPLTGPSAVFGIDQIQALKWAVEDINAKGGVNGCKLEPIIADNQAKPDVAIAVTNRMIQVDKVPVIVTAFSSVVKAIAPIANREKVLVLSTGANSPDLARLGDYVYTTFPLADVDMRALGPYLVKKGDKKAAVLFVNNDTGIEGAKVFRKSFEGAGGEVVLFDSYEESRTDFTGLILQVKAANPDVIHIHSVVSDFPTIVAQMRQLGITAQITSYQTAFSNKMIQDLGGGAEGIIVTSLAPSAADNANLTPYLERWKTEMGREPNGLPYTQYWHDAPYIVAELYRWVEAQKLPATGENLRKALLAIKTFDGPLTNATEIGEDHTVEKATYFWQVKDGKFVLIGNSAE